MKYQKIAEATGDLIVNKTADVVAKSYDSKITKVLRRSLGQEGFLGEHFDKQTSRKSKAPQGKISVFSPWKLLKIALQMRNFTHRWETFFQSPKKGQGGDLASLSLPPLVTRLWFMLILIQILIAFVKCQTQIFRCELFCNFISLLGSCTWYFSQAFTVSSGKMCLYRIVVGIGTLDLQVAIYVWYLLLVKIIVNLL